MKPYDPIKYGMNYKPVEWTPDMENRLAKCYQDKTTKELAGMFNCSQKSIFSKARNLGLRRKPRPPMKVAAHPLGWNKNTVFYQQCLPVKVVRCIVPATKEPGKNDNNH
ncbi:hypothetical protein [uncultured Duncaniella sp.]|uniref:hypothetical protein n=1 Tax=uncultured Duncaniella sp. TaxID=2768039 RepID=UPI0026770669|nr:hypothetical protein [uncultured Duncaniella sp.]